MVMLFDNPSLASAGARVAALSFGFLALVATQTYTANLGEGLAEGRVRAREAQDEAWVRG